MLYLDYSQYPTAKPPAPATPPTTAPRPVTQGQLPPPPPLEDRPVAATPAVASGVQPVGGTEVPSVPAPVSRPWPRSRPPRRPRRCRRLRRRSSGAVGPGPGPAPPPAADIPPAPAPIVVPPPAPTPPAEGRHRLRVAPPPPAVMTPPPAAVTPPAPKPEPQPETPPAKPKSPSKPPPLPKDTAGAAEVNAESRLRVGSSVKRGPPRTPEVALGSRWASLDARPTLQTTNTEPSREKDSRDVAPPAHVPRQLAADPLHVPQPVVDAGERRTGQPLVARFALVNAGRSRSPSSALSASWGCAMPTLADRTLARAHGPRSRSP